MNTKIRTVIVDNNPLCIQSLCMNLKKFIEIEIISTCTLVEEAKYIILKEQPDLLFLDVELPEQNGIELLEEIRHKIHSSICVIFCSTFTKYSIQAFRASAFDYLVKPYEKEELEYIISKVKNKIKNQDIDFEQSIRKFLSINKKFGIYTSKGVLLFNQYDILYFFKENRNWKIFTRNQNIYNLKSTTNSEDILLLSNSFFQISQKHIINIDYLYFIENNSLKCKFQDPFNQLDLPVTRRYYPKLKKALKIL